MTTTELAEEEILLPWDAVPSKATQENYLRLSRWFLEFGGFIDPAAVRHKPGPSAAKALERQATKEGMVRMVRELRSDHQVARTLVVQFIRKVNERIDTGEVADSWLESILKPVRLAFELNEILVPWKQPSAWLLSHTLSMVPSHVRYCSQVPR